MKKCKIEVIKTTFHEDLAKQYGSENIGKCPMHKVGDVFYYGDWIRKPGVAICSCNDGLRPVIFKLESTDEEAHIEYTPVR